MDAPALRTDSSSSPTAADELNEPSRWNVNYITILSDEAVAAARDELAANIALMDVVRDRLAADALPANAVESLTQWLDETPHQIRWLRDRIVRLEGLDHFIQKPSPQPDDFKGPETRTDMVALLARQKWYSLYTNQINLWTTYLWVHRKAVSGHLNPALERHYGLIRQCLRFAERQLEALPTESLDHPSILTQQCNIVRRKVDEMASKVLTRRARM